MKKFFRPAVLTIIALTSLTACGGGEGETAAAGEQAAVAPAAPAADHGGMAGMEGMGEAQGGGTADQMRSHFQMMNGVSGDSLKSMMPSHRQMTANMLSQFNSEMKQMNMAPDPAESALADSVRQDIRTMPELSASELEALMPTHQDRVMRLMESHSKMMGGMKM